MGKRKAQKLVHHQAHRGGQPHASSSNTGPISIPPLLSSVLASSSPTPIFPVINTAAPGSSTYTPISYICPPTHGSTLITTSILALQAPGTIQSAVPQLPAYLVQVPASSPAAATPPTLTAIDADSPAESMFPRVPVEILSLIAETLISTYPDLQMSRSKYVPPSRKWDVALDLQLVCKKMCLAVRHPSAWFPSRSGHMLFPFSPNNARGKLLQTYLDNVLLPDSDLPYTRSIQIQLSSNRWCPESLERRNMFMDVIKGRDLALSVRCSASLEWPIFPFAGFSNLSYFFAEHIQLASSWDAPPGEHDTAITFFNVLEANNRLTTLSLAQIPLLAIPSANLSTWTLPVLEELRLRSISAHFFKDCVTRLNLPAVRVFDLVCVEPFVVDNSIVISRDAFESVSEFRWWSSERNYREDTSGPLTLIMHRLPNVRVLTLQRVQGDHGFLRSLFRPVFPLHPAMFMDLSELIFKSCAVPLEDIVPFIKERAFNPITLRGIQTLKLIGCNFVHFSSRRDIERSASILQVLVKTLEMSSDSEAEPSRWRQGSDSFLPHIPDLETLQSSLS